MQVSISIEPYIALEKTKLTQYIDEIVRISRDFNQQEVQVSLHFDYFQENLDIFQLIQTYTDKIKVDLHLMQESVPNVDKFRSVSFDVVDWQKNQIQQFNRQKSKLAVNMDAVTQAQRGLVLDLGCNFQEYKDLIPAANYIIVMTVKCGKSGQTFNQSALQLVPQIRRLNPHATIIIDGGVNETNIDLLYEAGVDVAVVGNYAKKCYENGNLAIGINRLLHN